MKKLVKSALVFAAIGLASVQSFASEKYNGHKDWDTFRQVTDSYFNTDARFLKLSKTGQEDFFTAAESIKDHLYASSRPHAKELSRKVELAEKAFQFIWNNQPAYV